MKTKLKLLSLASMLAVSNMSAIEIGPTGSGVEMSGFIDLYYESKDASGSDTVGVGQVEIMFDYASGPISASVDIDFYNSGTNTVTYLGADGLVGGTGVNEDSTYDVSDNDGSLEEAIVTYDFGNGLSVTAGKMLSYLGFEAYDPTNMYQYSYAYERRGENNTGAQMIYDAYATGASVDYGNDMFSIGVWTSLANSPDLEYALAFTGVENLTVKAIYADYGKDSTASLSTKGKSTYWASYQIGKLLLAAEVAEAEGATASDTDLEGMLLMANYGITDKIGLTLRYSEFESTTGTTKDFDTEKITISPSYVFNDNFSGLVEYSTYDEGVAGTRKPTDFVAVELIYTF
ncbi:porin [Opitutales bacterium]|nr:porin [Opitutales bacterium]